jgi:hypothetical protein
MIRNIIGIQQIQLLGVLSRCRDHLRGDLDRAVCPHGDRDRIRRARIEDPRLDTPLAVLLGVDLREECPPRSASIRT